MSSFCGYIGKTDSETIDNIVEKLEKNCQEAPICFDDGYFHFGFAPFEKAEEEKVAHNDEFTVWVLLDCGYSSSEYTAKKFVEAYERCGISFIKELEGTFAFALWDGIQKRLYLVKDRYGAKPLLYAKLSQGFLFGSEIKLIKECLKMPHGINMSALYQYMSFQSVYLPETVFEDVYHVSPGHYGIYADGKYEEICYVNSLFGKSSDDTYEVALQKVESYLQNSVSKCLDAKKTGILLSGGLDSSLVAALAPSGMIEQSYCLKPLTKKGSLHQKDEDAFFSEKLAKKYGFIHHVIDMTPRDLVDSVDEIIECFSQPFSGTISGYFVYKHAAKECKQLLTGDGADELFGSYRHHSVTIPLERYASMKERGDSVVGAEKNFAPYENNLAFLEAMYQYGGKNDTLWYYRLLQMGDNEKGLFLSRDRFGEYIEKNATLKLCAKWDKSLQSTDVLNRSLERDFKHLLPGHIMLYQDTLARNFGINLVMPFLNNQLTEYVAALPSKYKIKEGITKSILKDVARKYLQKEVVDRRKEPFSLPVFEWMLTDLKEYVTDILCVENIKKYDLLDANSVLYALNEFYKYPYEKSYYGVMLWSMAMLQKWAMLHM